MSRHRLSGRAVPHSRTVIDPAGMPAESREPVEAVPMPTDPTASLIGCLYGLAALAAVVSFFVSH